MLCAWLSIFCPTSLTFCQENGRTRANVPDDDALADARLRVESAFASDRSKALLLEQRRKLANDYLKTALESENNLADQFALLDVATETASNIGDHDTVFAVLDAMFRRFNVDELALVERHSKILEDTASVNEKRKLLGSLAKWIAKAIGDGRFDAALSLNAIESRVAAKVASPTAVTTASKHQSKIQEFVKEFETFIDAQKLLQVNPDNPDALKTVGGYKCFVLGEWDSGLQMLVRTNDAALRRLAASDLDKESDKVMLAHDWFAYGEQSSGQAKEGALRRAAYWYQHAMPNITGLSKKLATSNLNTINAFFRTDAAPASPTDNEAEEEPKIIMGEWVQVYPVVASSPKWSIEKGVDTSVRTTNNGLILTSNTATAIQFPVSAESMVMSIDVEQLQGNSVYVELRVAGNVGYSYSVTSTGEHIIGKYDESGFRPIKTVRTSLGRGTFSFQAAVLDSELILWTNGIKRVSIRDESIKGKGSLRLGAFGQTIVKLSAVKYLLPTKDQITVFSTR